MLKEILECNEKSEKYGINIKLNTNNMTIKVFKNGHKVINGRLDIDCLYDEMFTDYASACKKSKEAITLCEELLVG